MIFVSEEANNFLLECKTSPSGMTWEVKHTVIAVGAFEVNDDGVVEGADAI